MRRPMGHHHHIEHRVPLFIFGPHHSGISPTTTMSPADLARENHLRGHNLRSQTLPISQEIKQSGRVGRTKHRVAQQIKKIFRIGGYVPQADARVLHYTRKRTPLESPNLPWARLQYYSYIRCNVEVIPISSVDLNMLPPEPFGPFDPRPPTPKRSCPPEPMHFFYANQDLEPLGAPPPGMDALSRLLEGHHISASWSKMTSSRLRENCFGQFVLKHVWWQKVSIDYLSSLLADCHLAMGDD